MGTMWKNFCEMVPKAIDNLGGPLVLMFLFIAMLIVSDMYGNYLDHVYPDANGKATITVEAK